MAEIKTVRIFEEYLTAEDIAKTFKIAKTGIFNMMKRGDFPKGIKIGKSRRWSLKEIQAWIENKGAMANE